MKHKKDQRTKFKLYRLKPNEDHSTYWEWVVTTKRNSQGVGNDCLSDIDLSDISPEKFNVLDEYLDIFDFVLGFNNLEELRELKPEEFI